MAMGEMTMDAAVGIYLDISYRVVCLYIVYSIVLYCILIICTNHSNRVYLLWE